MLINDNGAYKLVLLLDPAQQNAHETVYFKVGMEGRVVDARDTNDFSFYPRAARSVFMAAKRDARHVEHSTLTLITPDMFSHV